MDSSIHNMPELFAQLGLPSHAAEIEAFILKHKGVPPHVSLDQAEFWSSSQASFLRDALEQDSDWAEITDQLSALLRA